MLQSIRDRTQGWIAGVIISLVILSFALWGIHSYMVGSANTDVVAKVNGVEVSKRQLSAAYERLRRQVQLSNGSGNVPDNIEGNLKRRALESLIHIQVLKQASVAEGYRVTPRQVDGYLESMPEFQVNGQFSAARFQQLIASSYYSIADFLDLINTTLLIDQPRLGIVLSGFALPDEVDASIALVNQERDIQYMRLPLDYFLNQNIPVSDDEIKAYYTEHQNDFKTPEQLTVEYIDLTLKDVMANIHPTEDELKTYYNDNPSAFTDPDKKTKDLLTGKATEAKTTEPQPFDQVRDKVSAALTKQQAEEKLADLKEKLANIAYEHPESLEPAAKALGLPVNVSPLFSLTKGSEEGITAIKKIRDAAFSEEVLTAQNNSDVLQVTPDESVVIRVKSHVPAALMALDSVRQQIADILKKKKADDKAQATAQEIQKKLQAGTPPEQIAVEYNFPWEKLGFIGRYSTSVDSAVLFTAFRLPKPADKMASYATVKIPNGFAVVATNAVRDGKAGDNKEQYEAFAEQMQASDATLEYKLYEQSLMEKASITSRIDQSDS